VIRQQGGGAAPPRCPKGVVGGVARPVGPPPPPPPPAAPADRLPDVPPRRGHADPGATRPRAAATAENGTAQVAAQAQVAASAREARVGGSRQPRSQRHGPPEGRRADCNR